MYGKIQVDGGFIRILILSNPNSTHTIKWINALHRRGINILLFGLTKCKDEYFSSMPDIRIETLEIEHSEKELTETTISKVKYLKAVKQIKRIIEEFKPDILHAHYATSYGLISSLTGFSPLVISVWGSDIFEFPLKSIIHKLIIQYVFYKADRILSTSVVMADEIKKYTKKNVTLTPFGVNTKLFNSSPVNSIFHEDDVVIGTVKDLKPVYGIDKLIKVFHIIKLKFPELRIKLLIVGSGPQESELKALAQKLNLQDEIIFTGNIENKEIPRYYNMMKLAVFLSKSESFGVAVLEASACGIPVVASSASGFTETVVNGKSGIIVDANNLENVADVIKNLLSNQDMRKKFSNFGRDWVRDNFEEEKTIDNMISLYMSLLNKKVNLKYN